MKLILFCDYGLDDALATHDALLHAKDDGYDGVDLVAVGGNVPADVALRNAKKLVAQFPFRMPPVRVVDTTAIPQPCEFLKDVHGQDGMGELFGERFTDLPVLSYGEWIKEERVGYDLLSLGPMTLVPALLRRGGVRKFIFMGGNIAEEPNFHGYEFNHALNRAAFSQAVLYDHVAVTMDTCRSAPLNIQNRELRGEGLACKMANRSRELSLGTGEKGCYVWDDIAVKYLRHPEWFSLYAARDRDGNALTVARYVYGKRYEEILTE